jgi:homoprotocatechuate degradation regulator HpaR
MREFRRSLPMSLMKAREAVMKTFIPKLREHDLSSQQWRVLRALFDAVESDNPEVEMSLLADRCFLLMPSLSRIVQNLEQRKLIKRRTSDSDKRSSMIKISKSGISLVNILAPSLEQRYAHITEVFGYGKLELLYELLDELTIKLQAADTDSTA